MALPDAVVGSTHTVTVITWTRKDDSVVDLTQSTLTGVIRNRATGAQKNIVGALALVDAVGGVLSWTKAAGDVDTEGHFLVQFTATYPDATVEISVPEAWRVLESY